MSKMNRLKVKTEAQSKAKLPPRCYGVSAVGITSYLRWQPRARGGGKELEVVMPLTPVSASSVYHRWLCLLKGPTSSSLWHQGKKQSNPKRKEDENEAAREIRLLQKQLQIAAAKRRSYHANARQQMLSQEREIESMTQEREETWFKLSQLQRKTMLEERALGKLQHLSDSWYFHESLVRERKGLLAELDKEILELEEKIVKQNQKVAKIKQSHNVEQLEKEAERLEKNLQTATVLLNTTLTENKELKGEIQSLQVRKAVLDNISMGLHQKLNEQTQKMTTTLEQSTGAYDQRMETLAEMSALEEKHSKERVRLLERQRVFESMNSLRSFMVTKRRDRSQLEKEAQKRRAFKAAQRERLSRGESWESREAVHRYLLELSENGNIEEELNRCVEKLEKEFACLSYSTELNEDVEKLQLRIEALQEEIAAITREQDTAKSSSLQVLQELEVRLKETTEEANMYEQRCNMSSKVLGQLKSRLEVLLQETRRDCPMVLLELGGTGEVTDDNLLQCFGLLEKTIVELLLQDSRVLYASTVDTDSEEPVSIPLLAGLALLQRVVPIRLCPPALALEGPDELLEALDVPLDYEEMRQLVLRSQQGQGSAEL
ncbi:coiled-coil domain-containing protein 63 [Apus apus]|uniref:coiled-coil domain-containing protein 63 n=1 Tax=Apus apus TaxID=8895 RepID=UPI0021F82C9D|nr:coiled-coil domain-containing protein 63 [Apus apus]